MSATSALGNAADSASNLSVASGLGSRSAAGEMTIGEMAREFGVTLRTLRFYEDRAMIHPRRVGNARYYSGPDRLRLEMILKGKRLGFTLAEIGELIGAEDGAAKTDFEGRLRPAQIVDQLDHLERQRREIEEAIASLKAMHERLSRQSGAPEARLAE
ncbi:MAG: MerR family transcriptional regulator [Roseiarcus sp.]